MDTMINALSNSPKMARFLAAVLFISQLALAQRPPASVFRTDFNSSLVLTPAQIEASQLGADAVESLQNIYNYEVSQLAFGGPEQDDFYTLPPLGRRSNSTGPGEVLKVQLFTDQDEFSTPPGTVLSRIMYTTTNFNGTVIPTTGFVLWPYLPRKIANRTATKASVVVWAHGTSGFFRPAAPSAHRGLWYDYSAPFELAKQGYAVFAPDYAGLGVGRSWDGSDITHQYLFHRAAAYDSLYGFHAALAAFPDRLENNFVVMGQSQGGNAAWSVAETLALEAGKFKDVLRGYRGAIPVSPSPDITNTPVDFILPAVSFGLSSVFPSFKLEDWLIPLGVARAKLLKELRAGVGVTQNLLLAGDSLLRPDYNLTWYAGAVNEVTRLGNKNFVGPLLVVQGSADPYSSYNSTLESVEEAWESFPDHSLELLVATGAGHVPVLSTTQQYWLQWIQDRLEEKPLTRTGPVRTVLEGMFPTERHKLTSNSYVQWAALPEYNYQVIFPV